MPVDSGAYRVEVWGEVSTPFQWNPEDFKPEWFRIYPNPFHDTLRVLTNALHPAKLELFDLAGRKVLHAEVKAPSTDIDARSLTAGLYFARIRSYWGKADALKAIKE